MIVKDRKQDEQYFDHWFDEPVKDGQSCSLCSGGLEYPFVHYVGFGDGETCIGDGHTFICQYCCNHMNTRGFQRDLAEMVKHKR